MDTPQYFEIVDTPSLFRDSNPSNPFIYTFNMFRFRRDFQMEKEKNFGDVINLSEDFSINLKENGTFGKQFTEDVGKK